jgi:hypothetical protein
MKSMEILESEINQASFHFVGGGVRGVHSRFHYRGTMADVLTFGNLAKTITCSYGRSADGRHVVMSCCRAAKPHAFGVHFRSLILLVSTTAAVLGGKK